MYTIPLITNRDPHTRNTGACLRIDLVPPLVIDTGRGRQKARVGASGWGWGNVVLRDNDPPARARLNANDTLPAPRRRGWSPGCQYVHGSRSVKVTVLLVDIYYSKGRSPLRGFPWL